MENRVKTILVIKLSSLGDIIHTLPVAWALKDIYQDAHLTWMVNASYRGLLEICPAIHEVLFFERNKKNGIFRSLLSILRLIGKIRREKFDLVIDLQGLLRSGLIGWLSGGKKVLGLESAREGSRWLYDIKVPVPKKKSIHAVDRYLLIPEYLGWTGSPRFQIKIQPDEDRFIDGFLKAEKARTYLPLIGIHPVARWKTKVWSLNNFARLADLISATEKFQLVLLGSEEDQKQIIQMIHMMKYSPVIATGKFNLKQLTAFLKRSSLLITTDSGPMHLAAAMESPLLAIFGATDQRKTGPYKMENDVIFKNIQCRPCLKRTCLNSGYPMECMERITPEEVFERFKKKFHL